MKPEISKILHYFCPVPPLRILFLGSKPIGYFCLLHMLEQSEKLGYQMVGVLHNENPLRHTSLSVGELARQYSIPVFDHPEDMPECDLLISVQYHRILKPKEIAKASKLAVNLHMAPLPEYRGCNQFSLAILENRSTFGTTIHKMSPRIDEGDILFEKRFPIPDQCWVDELHQLTEEASLLLFRESWPLLLSEQYTAVPQSQWIEERGCSLHFRNEIHTWKQIDLNWDAERIERHIRATSMPGFEPPYTMLGCHKIYFQREWPEKE